MSDCVLYLTYDGVLEPLGQSQVLRYLEHLSKSRKIVLISFEKSVDWLQVERRESLCSTIRLAGIVWVPLRYHKRPSVLATGYDIAQGLVVGAWAVIRFRVRIIHARSYVSSVIALALKKLLRLRFVFDMRGFWADERVDGGLWPPESNMYLLAKWVERQLLLNADHIVSLTHAAVREIERFPYMLARMPHVTVIPTCADLVRFCPQPEIEKEFLLGYVGSAGTWYDFDAIVACFAELLRFKPEARFLIINRNEHDYISERLIAGGVPLAAVELLTASHSEVPAQMVRVRAGIFFYKPSFSRVACAPTKLGEFLGCGIPCLANNGVGDMAKILEGERVGVAVGDFSPKSLRTGLARLLDLVVEPGIEARCVAAAHKHFSLNDGVDKYRAVYQRLISDPGKKA